MTHYCKLEIVGSIIQRYTIIYNTTYKSDVFRIWSLFCDLQPRNYRKICCLIFTSTPVRDIRGLRQTSVSFYRKGSSGLSSQPLYIDQDPWTDVCFTVYNEGRLRVLSPLERRERVPGSTVVKVYRFDILPGNSVMDLLFTESFDGPYSFLRVTQCGDSTPVIKQWYCSRSDRTDYTFDCDFYFIN